MILHIKKLNQYMFRFNCIFSTFSIFSTIENIFKITVENNSRKAKQTTLFTIYL